MRVGDGTPGPGRPAGLKNKMTTKLKEMILGALDDAGGQKYLLEQAYANPVAFLTLLGKVLPTTLAQDSNNPLFLNVSTEELEDRAIAKLVAKGIEQTQAQAIVRGRAVH